MKIKIYYHDEIISPAFNEKSEELPEGVLFDGSHHELVYKGDPPEEELGLNEIEDDQHLLETLFTISGEKRLPNFEGRRYRPLGYADVVVIDKRAYVCRTKDWMPMIGFPIADHKLSGEFRLIGKLQELVRHWGNWNRRPLMQLTIMNRAHRTGQFSRSADKLTATVSTR